MIDKGDRQEIKYKKKTISKASGYVLYAHTHSLTRWFTY